MSSKWKLTSFQSYPAQKEVDPKENLSMIYLKKVRKNKKVILDIKIEEKKNDPFKNKDYKKCRVKEFLRKKFGNE